LSLTGAIFVFVGMLLFDHPASQRTLDGV
jgi:hypothetical protein